jgi:hypothetical protein
MTKEETEAVAEFRASLDTLRNVFASILRDSLGHGRTAGSCGYACMMLQPIIEKFHPSLRVVVRGGDGAGDGGFIAADGRGHGHYWIEVQGLAGEDWVVDIVADQFGLDPIQFGTASDLAGRYLPGDQQVVDEQLAELRAELGGGPAPMV